MPTHQAVSAFPRIQTAAFPLWGPEKPSDAVVPYRYAFILLILQTKSISPVIFLKETCLTGSLDFIK